MEDLLSSIEYSVLRDLCIDVYRSFIFLPLLLSYSLFKAHFLTTACKTKYQSIMVATIPNSLKTRIMQLSVVNGKHMRTTTYRNSTLLRKSIGR